MDRNWIGFSVKYEDIVPRARAVLRAKIGAKSDVSRWIARI